MTWDSSDWSIVLSPNIGDYGNFLSSLSCVSADFCIAIGNYGNDFADLTLVMALASPEPVPSTTTTTSSVPVTPSFAG
jgi:hypothetical protein